MIDQWILGRPIVKQTQGTYRIGSIHPKNVVQIVVFLDLFIHFGVPKIGRRSEKPVGVGIDETAY